MQRRVFYSFHYDGDSTRASQVRNMGVVEGNEPAKDNDWEQVRRGGDPAIQRWIDSQLVGRSCTIVLIGSDTANRPWINYEISTSWNAGMGVFGINIHSLKNLDGNQTHRGANPFDFVKFKGGGALSTVVRVYDPPFSDSKMAYGHIRQNLGAWIEAAIAQRA